MNESQYRERSKGLKKYFVRRIRHYTKSIALALLIIALLAAVTIAMATEGDPGGAETPDETVQTDIQDETGTGSPDIPTEVTLPDTDVPLSPAPDTPTDVAGLPADPTEGDPNQTQEAPGLGQAQSATETNPGDFQNQGEPGQLIYDNIISGMLWLDLNNDGTHNAGEFPVQGYPVNLFRVGGSEAAQTVLTNTDGKYSFVNIEPGSYFISISPNKLGPDKYLLPFIGIQNNNKFAIASNWLTANTVAIDVADTSIVGNMDAGMRIPLAIMPAAVTVTDWVSLNEAIQAAPTNGVEEEIIFYGNIQAPSGGGISITGGRNIKLTGGGTLTGADSSITITLSSSKLTLNGVIVTHTAANGPNTGISVDSNSELVLLSGVIIGNVSTSNVCGGVYNQGVFTMSGGAIAGNSGAFEAGGVYNTGTFTMSGGVISGNTVTGTNGRISAGGGVYNTGIFNMTGGTISGNTATGLGGGVYNAGVLNISGGAITDNTAGLYGGGIYHISGQTLTLNNALFSGNTAGDSGGGLYSSASLINIYDTAFENNSANGNSNTSGGGAIWVPYENLGDLTVNAGCSFYGNTAVREFLRLPEDDALYASNILANLWSIITTGAPNAQGYNNYDISYYRIDVVFDKNHNDATGWTEAGPNRIIINYGDRLALRPADPTRAGYLFQGWWLSDNGTGNPLDFGQTLIFSVRTVTYYAQWLPVNQFTYTVTYHGNGNTDGLAPTDNNQYTSDTLVTAASQGDLQKSGSVFSGWNTAADGSGYPLTAGMVFYIIGDLNLYAQWTAIQPPVTFSITYHSNGNSGGYAPLDENVYSDNDLVSVLGSGIMTKTGYTFSGWNTAADGSGTSFSVGSVFNITANMTLYAQWTLYQPPTTPATTPPTPRPPSYPQSTPQTELPDAPQLTEPIQTATDLIDENTDLLDDELDLIDEGLVNGLENGSGNGTNSSSSGNGGAASLPQGIRATTSSLQPLDIAEASRLAGIPTMVIGDSPTPLYAPPAHSDSVWALGNLIMCIAGAAMSVTALVTFANQRKRLSPENKNARKSVLWFITAGAMGIAGFIIFMVTQDMHNAMVLVDKWTVLGGVILMEGIVCVSIMLKNKKALDFGEDDNIIKLGPEGYYRYK